MTSKAKGNSPRKRVLALVAVCGAASVAFAAPANAAPANVILGHICYRSEPRFTIIADGPIPQGSTWRIHSGTNPGTNLQMEVGVDSPLIQSTTVDRQTVDLRAQVQLNSGTVVTIEPYYYVIPNPGSTTLTLSGYGGSHTVTAGDRGTCG